MDDGYFLALKYNKITERKIPRSDRNKSIVADFKAKLHIYLFFTLAHEKFDSIPVNLIDKGFNNE